MLLPNVPVHTETQSLTDGKGNYAKVDQLLNELKELREENKALKQENEKLRLELMELLRGD